MYVAHPDRERHVRASASVLSLSLSLTSFACADEAATEQRENGITLAVDVMPVKDVEDAKPGVFIPPFERCAVNDEGDEICTNVAISGCTEEGYDFADYGDCDVVRTQRPYWPAPPAAESSDDDPRLEDEDFMAELAWAKDQIESSGCVCCHDSSIGVAASQWDISRGPIWLDTLSDTGLALFTGLADSSVLGAYPKDDNHGFDRMKTGIPTIDTERMKELLLGELERRGITEEEASAVPPFGGPIYANSVAVPTACDRGQGVDPEGRLRFGADRARYVYVLELGSKNPGVPPNLDRPDGMLWRLDVLASAEAIEDGFAYGETPRGAFQAFPERTPAAALEEGTSYHLVALRDVGVPIASCVFVYGEALVNDAPDASVSDASQSGGDAGACDTEIDFGAPCSDAVTHSECGCEASYCALMPGQSEGYCTARDCLDDPSVCPQGWSCFDVSMFQPGAPAICLEP
jgi:hypothetical protein